MGHDMFVLLHFLYQFLFCSTNRVQCSGSQKFLQGFSEKLAHRQNSE